LIHRHKHSKEDEFLFRLPVATELLRCANLIEIRREIELIMSNAIHVNILNNRWALKVLYSPCLSSLPTYIVQTIPSSRLNRPQTIIEILSPPPVQSLLVIRQHFRDNTRAIILPSTSRAAFDQSPILTADVVAQTVDYSTVESTSFSSSCSICLGDFHQPDCLLQLTCKHIFHRECLLHWLQTHSRCPYCRFAVYQQPVTPHIFLIR
jgi:hypothetical protein